MNVSLQTIKVFMTTAWRYFSGLHTYPFAHIYENIYIYAFSAGTGGTYIHIQWQNFKFEVI